MVYLVIVNELNVKLDIRKTHISEFFLEATYNLLLKIAIALVCMSI